MKTHSIPLFIICSGIDWDLIINGNYNGDNEDKRIFPSCGRWRSIYVRCIFWGLSENRVPRNQMVLIFVPDLNGYFRVYLIFRHAHMCIYNYIYTYIVYDLYGVSRRKTWDEADEYFHFLGHSPSCILTCFSTWEPAGLSIFKSSAGNLMAGPISPFHPHIFIYIYIPHLGILWRFHP